MSDVITVNQENRIDRMYYDVFFQKKCISFTKYGIIIKIRDLIQDQNDKNTHSYTNGGISVTVITKELENNPDKLCDITIKIKVDSSVKYTTEDRKKEDSNSTSVKNNSNELITLEELKNFGWVTANEEFTSKLNAALKRYGISNKGSIALFMATMAEESGWGKFSLENRTNFSRMTYDSNTMGAGYIQITHEDTHKLFLKTMGDDFSGINTASYIAKHYPLESAVWFWSSNKAKGTGKGKKWSLNEYVENNGSSKGVFLVTQYYVNGWIMGSNGDNSLGSIKSGAPYDDTSTKGKLKINGYTYDLPANWYKRSENYDKAIKIWR